MDPRAATRIQDLGPRFYAHELDHPWNGVIVVGKSDGVVVVAVPLFEGVAGLKHPSFVLVHRGPQSQPCVLALSVARRRVQIIAFRRPF